jgi:hypothetical protein
VTGRLGGQARSGELAQLVIHQRQELYRIVRVALCDVRQDARNVAHYTFPMVRTLLMSLAPASLFEFDFFAPLPIRQP